MTGRNFIPGEAAQKPGPGAYCPERVRGFIYLFIYLIGGGLKHRAE